MILDKSKLRVGMRTIKTAVAVLICLLLYLVIGQDRGFMSATAAIICMQSNIEQTVRAAVNRMQGTLVGAIIGMLLLSGRHLIEPVDLTFLLASAGIIPIVIICNMLGRSDSIVIACVVFLVIMLQRTELSPFIYSLQRMADTLIGCFVALIVNRLIVYPPVKKDPTEEDKDHPDSADDEAQKKSNS